MESEGERRLPGAIDGLAVSHSAAALPHRNPEGDPMKWLPMGRGRGVSGGGCQSRGQKSAALAAPCIPGIGGLLLLLSLLLLAGLLAACQGPQTGPGLEPPGALGSGDRSTHGATMPQTAGTGGASFGNSEPGQVPQPTTIGTGGTTAGVGSPSASMGGAGSAASADAGATYPPAMGGTNAADCASTRVAVQLGVHLLVDESAAMVFPNDMWSPLGQALDSLVSSESGSELQLGVQFFQGACDPNSYAAPALPIGPVAQQQPALDAAMGARTHGPGAATTLALDGALAHARQWATDSQGNPAVVLISGSEPTACLGNASTAAASAATGLDQMPAVPTYVVALGATASLDQVAQAGGSTAALQVAEPTSQQALLEALQAAIAQAGCSIALPATAAPYLPDQVNLELTSGGATTTLVRVTDAASCDPSAGGWYFDAAQSPKRALLCDASCKQVTGGGSVSIVTGCATRAN